MWMPLGLGLGLPQNAVVGTGAAAPEADGEVINDLTGNKIVNDLTGNGVTNDAN